MHGYAIKDAVQALWATCGSLIGRRCTASSHCWSRRGWWSVTTSASGGGRSGRSTRSRPRAPTLSRIGSPAHRSRRVSSATTCSCGSSSAAWSSATSRAGCRPCLRRTRGPIGERLAALRDRRQAGARGGLLVDAAILRTEAELSALAEGGLASPSGRAPEPAPGREPAPVRGDGAVPKLGRWSTPTSRNGCPGTYGPRDDPGSHRVGTSVSVAGLRSADPPSAMPRSRSAIAVARPGGPPAGRGA